MDSPRSTRIPMINPTSEEVSMHRAVVENDTNGPQPATNKSIAQDPKYLRTVFHIYPLKERHRRITTSIDLKHESPLCAAQRAARKAKKEAKKGIVVSPEANSKDEANECAFFLHSPYLAFHGPPKVLYAGENKHAVPAVLIHGSAFWRRYTLQYGDSLAEGVLDPRGVVMWKHNGGNKKELKADRTKLKGYKVKTWRLWGETGKAYVHQVKANRTARVGPDPDDDPKATVQGSPARADGVVHLKWERPFSRHTRRYHFHYAGIDFYWKGTKTVKKPGFCGSFLRYTHLKLVAKAPLKADTGSASQSEIVLGTFICSVSKKKSGRLELLDSAMLEFFEAYLQPPHTEWVEQDKVARLVKLKETWLYRIAVATAICMIAAEQEKRKAVGEWIEEAAENAGG